MTTSSTVTASTAHGRALDPRVLAQVALFASLMLAAVLDLLGRTFALGAPLASAIVWPAAGVLLGLAMLRTGLVGARPILVAAAVIAFAVTTAEIVDPAINRFREPPGGVLPSVLTAVLAVVAAAAALTIRDERGERPLDASGIHRSTGQRATLLILATLGLAALVVETAGAFGPGNVDNVASFSNGVQTVVSLVSSGWVAALAIGLVAWWWGRGWLLALGGASTIAAIAAVPLEALAADAIPAVFLGFGSVVAGLRPPGGRSFVGAIGRADRSPIRPTVAAVWAVSGSILLVPTLLIGRFPPILEDCFGQCPPLSPLADVSGYLDLAAVLLVPIAALALAFAPTSRPVANGSVAAVGLVAAIVVLLQVVLGQLGVRPFGYMGTSAPAALLVLLGFGLAAWRPTGLEGTGWIASLAIALLAVIWIAAAFVGGFGIVWPTNLSALFEAGVTAVALALAFGAAQGRTAVA